MFQQRAAEYLVQGRKILWRNYAIQQNNNEMVKGKGKCQGQNQGQEEAGGAKSWGTEGLSGKWKLPGHKIFERLVVRLGKRSEALQVRNLSGGGGGGGLESPGVANGGESLVIGSIFEHVVLYEIFTQTEQQEGTSARTRVIRQINAPLGQNDFVEHRGFVEDLSKEGWRLGWAVVVQLGARDEREQERETGVDTLLEELYGERNSLEQVCVLSGTQAPPQRRPALVRSMTFRAEGVSLDFLKWNTGTRNVEEVQGKAEIRFRFKRPVLEQLKAFCTKNGMDAEYFGVLIYALTLHKYAGAQCDPITVSTNTGALLMLNCSSDATILDLIDQMKRQMSIVESSGQDGGAGGENCGSGSDLLVFEQQLRQNVLKFCVSFDRTALHDVLVAQFVGSFKKLFLEVLEDGVRGDVKVLGAYSALSEEQLRQQLEEWNSTTRPDYNLQVSVIEMFERRVEEMPDAMAVTLGGGGLQWTYAQLNAAANRVAHHLRRVHVIGRGAQSELVAVSMERSVEMLAGILGVLKAGGAYVPIDPNYPTERVQYMLQDSEATVVVTQRHLVQRLGLGTGVPVLALDSGLEELQGERVDNLERAEEAERVAYVIYTSGSTGRPKGVMIRHRNLSNYLHWCQELYVGAGDGSGRQVALYSSISFDLTVTSIFAPLVCGLPIFMAPPSASFDRTLEEFDGHQFEFLKLTPSHLDLLTAHRQLRQDTFGLEEPPLTRTFIVGGENLTYSQVKTLLDGHTRIINEYGPTETTVGCTTHTLLDADPDFVGSIPIGRPIANTQMYVLDKQLRPVPVGAIGELYIGGAGVGLGYWKRPDLTSEKFVPNLFLGEGQRMYRTGDLGRWTPDGNLVFLGRIDDQVKIRGFRVELPEIESAVEQFPNVRQCAVCVEGAPPVLAAYLILQEPDVELEVAALREWLGSRLLVHMVPSSFTVVPPGMTFPLSPGGKIDKKRLSSLGLPRVDESASYVGGRNDLEVTACHAWAEELRLPRVGIDDDFFRLGGDSVRCIQLVGRLNQLLQHELDYKLNSGHVYANPTVRRLFDALHAPENPKGTGEGFWANLMGDCKKNFNFGPIDGFAKCDVAEVEFVLPGGVHSTYRTQDEELVLSAYAVCHSRMTGRDVNHVAVTGGAWGYRCLPMRLQVMAGEIGETLKNVKEMYRQVEREAASGSKIPPQMELGHLPGVSFGRPMPEEQKGADILHVELDECIDGSGTSRVHVGIRSCMGPKYLEVVRAHLLGAVEEILCHCDRQAPHSPLNYTMSDFSLEFDPYIVYNGGNNNTGMDSDTVFMFPPALGGAESYLANVCQGVAPTKRLVLLNNWYLFLSRAFGQAYEQGATLEVVAAEYVRLLKSIQVRGPYQLFGWSFGGLLAAEVARQLVVMHRDTVQRLIMVDPLFSFKNAVQAVGAGCDVAVYESRYHVTYAYTPPAWSPPPEMEIVLFKAEVGVQGEHDLEWMDEEYRQFYNTFNFDSIYAYYAHSTRNNHLDSILGLDSFDVVSLGACNHFSWAHNEEQLAAICKRIN